VFFTIPTKDEAILEMALPTDDANSPDALAQDILRAGAGHSYPKAAQILAISSVL
jgi:hypothetical protein